MKEIEKIQDLQKETSGYLDCLNYLNQEVSILRGILDFNYVCLNYAEANIPHQIIDDWAQTNPIFTELSRRLQEVYQDSPQNAVQKIHSTEITAGSAFADTFSFILNNRSYIDGMREKEGFFSISATYNQFINGEDARKEIHSFLYRINPMAASKFIEGSGQLKIPPPIGEDINPLNDLRSALNLTIRTLVDRIGEAKPPTQTEIIPKIAKFYGKDQTAQIDLAIRNRNFLLLWIKLSKTKDTSLSSDQAMGISLEIISILHLFTRTIKLPSKM
jgi:hypothetical protein